MKTAKQRRIEIVIIMVVIAAFALAGRESAQSVDEALRGLHRTQSEAADWDGFQPGSSVTYIRAGKSGLVGDYREKVTQIMTERTLTELKFEMVLPDGERDPWPSASTEIWQLAAVNARKIGEEDLFVGQNKFHTVVYKFSFPRYGKSHEETYWLAFGVPDGVVRHHQRVEGIGDPTFFSESDMKITDLNVELKAGNKTVHGYCFETEDGARGAKFTRERICKSKEVPGAVVTGERSQLDGTVESLHVRQTVESFRAVR